MKSRILTPSSALPARPHGFALGRGRPLLEDFAPPFLAFSFTTFFDDFFAETLAFAALDFAFATLLRVAIVSFLSLKSVLRRVSMALHYFFRSVLCGLRLPIRPLSLPAAGSITALISVGLPESIAALTACFNSSGEVALMPTPPKASIILS